MVLDKSLFPVALAPFDLSAGSSVNSLPLDIPLVTNPELTRVSPDDGSAFLSSRPEQIFTLTPDTLLLLARFRSPATVRALLGVPSPLQQAVLKQLLELRILQVEGTVPDRLPLPRTPILPSFLCAPLWHGTYDGLDASGTPAPKPRSRTCVIVGAPWDRGTLAEFSKGTSGGPRAIRSASTPLALRFDLATGRPLSYFDADHARTLLENVSIYDAGDLIAPPAMPWPEYAARLQAILRSIRSTGAIPLVLGGDHSVSLPAISSIDAPAFGIVHIDAHSDLGDIRFPEDVHHGNVMRHVATLPNVKHLIQLGVRGILPSPHRLTQLPFESLSVHRLRTLSEEALGGLCLPDLPYYLSIDIDALDPGVAPGTPVPVPDGFGLLELRSLISRVLKARSVLGIDLVEVLPGRDPAALTPYAAVQLLLEAMGSLFA